MSLHDSLPDGCLPCQGHIDMVTEKNNDVQHDFFRDPIRLRLDDGWIKAEGTTLGAGDPPPPLCQFLSEVSELSYGV
jgi:di/tripeptidase